MNGREQGFLLLTSHLGDPERKPLTVAQLRRLASRVAASQTPDRERELDVQDLVSLGYSQAEAGHILELLSHGALLDYYLAKGRKAGCAPITRVSPDYPGAVRKRLGLDSPGCLWAKGDPALLHAPCVALVGSRELGPENHVFAREVGRQAATQGFVLVSGNARGADTVAQRACLEAGGCVISVVADALSGHRCRDRVLYLSEDGFDLAFSAQRALSRNRVIHSLAGRTFVAQATLRSGGTWSGTEFNLAHGLSSVFCFRDGSPASAELEQMGAVGIGMSALADIRALEENEISLFGR